MTETELPNLTPTLAERQDESVQEHETICCQSDEAIAIVNELLCYVQNKSHIMTVVCIVRICSEFYSGDVIVSAKSLLYNSIKTKDRLVIRRGVNKTKSDMQDIVKVILEMEPTDSTAFVARNLMDLPILPLITWTHSNLFRRLSQ